MTTRIFELSTGKDREEYTQIGFVEGDANADIRALFEQFKKAYRFPKPFDPEREDITDWWDRRAAAEQRAEKAGLGEAPQEDQFYYWLVKKKGFTVPEIMEVNL